MNSSNDDETATGTRLLTVLEEAWSYVDELFPDLGIELRRKRDYLRWQHGSALPKEKDTGVEQSKAGLGAF